jgi:formylglycine-generating enzyme required for sulfatase activity
MPPFASFLALLLTLSFCSARLPAQQSAAVAGHRIDSQALPRSAQAGDTWINPKDGAEMVYIPGGKFQMGDDDQDDAKRHTAEVSGFWIYRNCVTVAQYRKFCTETGAEMPPRPDFNPGWCRADHPILNVTWDEAQKYCKWAGVSLPTEAQWERAARGSDGRKFPWGDTWDPAKCANGSGGKEPGGTVPVGRYSDSPYGLSDMAGNVNQWCLDTYDPDFAASPAASALDPVNTSSGAFRVLRGGSYADSDPQSFRTANREDTMPGFRFGNSGIRCAARPK